MTYQITSRKGELLGIFPAICDQLKALVTANPGARIKAVATVDDPCHLHPAYETGNCPGCGTDTRI